MKDNERGAVVVEASIAFTTFMFVIYTILSLVNICYAQAKIGVAVNCATKELSQYCYLYSLTGVNKIKSDASIKGQSAEASVDSVVSGIELLFNEINSGTSTASSVVNTGKTAYNNISSGVQTVVEDPKEFILGCAYSVGSDLVDSGMSAVAEKLAHVLVKKNLVTHEGASCEPMLKYVGVVPKGDSYFDGIDFSESEILAGTSKVVKIVASYEIRVVRLLDLDITYRFTQCGKTNAWSVS